MSGPNILNINVGILGHVDSGKTSLVKALSTCLSTAALDKHPQSIERGITLDLGFSSFCLDIPDHLKNELGEGYQKLQFTLVDCPGHASLIRTIIGGAHIIDMIILVVDVNKGIQAQTAECIVIGEITTDRIVVALNKVDLLPKEDRDVRIKKMTNRIRKILSTTKFSAAQIVPVSACIGGEKVAAVDASKEELSRGTVSEGINELVCIIQRCVCIPIRNEDGPFYFAIDHCFPIKGHGTVLTGL